MRQAIVTKYLAPTSQRGSRVKATAEAGSVTIPWDHARNIDENHREAAQRLAEKYGWHAKHSLVGGVLPGGGYCFVMIPHKVFERCPEF